MNRRVVITGMGWITPLGHDLETVWRRLLAGESGIAPMTIFDARTYPTQFAAEVKGFRLEDFLGPYYEQHRGCSRNAGFALAAAELAWKSAGLDHPGAPVEPDAVGVYLGAGEGPIDFENFVAASVAGWDPERHELNAVRWAEVAARVLSADREFEQDPNCAAGHIACRFNAQGPNINTLTACAASTQALGEASMIIRRGDADIMISGGGHSMIHPLGVTGFNRLTALSTRNDACVTASRPFDRTRDGFVLGEGAGILILEAYETAQRRGAPILAEILGYGSTADAFRVTDMHETGRGAIGAMRGALTAAGLQPQDVDYISAHGTGTEENDKIETLAIRTVFGEHAKKVPISSVKSMLGHLIAGAGAVELITCVLALREQVIPPTINYHEPDPNCDLDYVPNEPRRRPVRVCLSNSFGFGGQNDTLVIRAPQD
ncbi:MAG: beta-ketoacyl-[acyl-carrier-protein] synthase family protein [Phycisphaerales bacterium]|nr:beta-ketoacyl-[acyl-carrier-protein] synthase family protein [Phycisphaerales bacterium]